MNQILTSNANSQTLHTIESLLCPLCVLEIFIRMHKNWQLTQQTVNKH